MNINREHPKYAQNKAMWRKYSHLYAGGEEMMSNAAEYLLRRNREAYDVYCERLSRAFYENYIGSAIDWYASTLFRREPILRIEGANEPGKAFFARLAEDCDRKGTALSDFFRKQMIEALVKGRSFVLVDFPRVDHRPLTRAEEDALGASRAYLVDFTAEQVINWQHDEEGNLEWAVIRTIHERQPSPEHDEVVREYRWTYYDKHRYRVYRAVGDATTHPELVAEGQHGMASVGLVPLFELRPSKGLWLMNKAASLQLEHFNKSNALAWALTMGLFAMPVIHSNREYKQIFGESYYLQLAPEDKFSWTEPTGNVYQLAAENLDRLKNEIYRVCYLMTQAGGGLNGGVPQSGLSKQRDFAITQEVLRAYGDLVKDTMKRVLRAIAAARQDDLTIDVSGLDEFDIGDFSSEIEDAKTLLALGAGSKTLRKQVITKLAFKYLCDVRQQVKDEIANEITNAVEQEGQQTHRIEEAHGSRQNSADRIGEPVAFTDARDDRGVRAERAGEVGAGIQE